MSNAELPGMPMAPPQRAEADQPYGAMPVAEAPVTETVAGVTENRYGFFTNKRLVGGATAVAVVLGVGSFVLAPRGQDRATYADEAEALAQDPGTVFSSCENGIFTGQFNGQENPYASSLNVTVPGDLMLRPSSDLDTKEALVSYLFNNKDGDGVACDSALGLSVLRGAIASTIGEGAAQARGFEGPFNNVNEQAELYANNPEAAQEDANRIGALIDRSAVLNDKNLEGNYYLVVGVPEGEKAEGRVEPITKNFAPETVWILALGNDTGSAMNNLVAIDRQSGHIYLLNSIGLAEATKQEQEQAAAQAQENQQNNQGGGSANRKSQGGGNNANEHNGDTNGCNGTCGEGGEGQGNGQGNGAGGGAGGGGSCGGSCGGGGETTTTKKPPVTTPPTTKPPVTVPPTTTPPTTRPPIKPPIDCHPELGDVC